MKQTGKDQTTRMMSHTGVTLLAAVAVITLSCLASLAHSSPLHLSLPALEQELNSLIPQSPPQDVSNQNVVHNPGDHAPPPSHMHDEALQDVFRNDQDVNEKESSSPTSGPPLQDSSDATQADVVSPDVVAKLSGDPSAATEDIKIPFGNVVGITGELEAGVASPSPALKEADQYGKEEEEEQEVLNGDSQKPQAQKTNPGKKDGKDGHPQERKTLASDAQGTNVEDVGVPGEGNHGRQQQDSGFQLRDTEEEELQSLQAENMGEEEEEEEEEEDTSKQLSLPEIKNLNQNGAAGQELNSMIQPSWKESYHADDMYKGYDDNDGDDDDNYDEADYWRKITADDNPHETYPENPSRKSSYPDSGWRLVDVEETPSYDFDDTMAPEQLERGAWHEEVKRGEEEEEQQQQQGDARFRPARVIVLNETLYLNSTEEDQLPKFRPVPMPDKFEDYDVNRDGVISLPELRYVSRATEGVRQAFRDADLDGDGWVDQVEFQKAGWWVQVEYTPSPPPPSPQDTPLPPSSSRRGNRVARMGD